MTSIDNIAEVQQLLQGYCPDAKVWMLSFARGNSQLDRVRFESLNPTFLVSTVKPA